MYKDKAPKLSLSDPIQFLKGVGPKRAQLLKNLNLQTLEDALLFFPHRYEDRSKIQSIGKLILGEPATFTGKVLAGGSYFVNRRRKIFELIIEDDTGVIRAKWFRFQEDYLNKRFPQDSRVIVSGKPTFNKYLGAGMEIIHPNIELLSDDPEDHLEVGRIVPVYPATEGLHIKFIRKMMHHVVENHASLLPEFLPDDLLRRHRFPERAEAIRLTHFPPSTYHASDLNAYRTPAQRRLIFEEMFLIQLGVAYKKKHFDANRESASLKTRGPVVRRLVKRLPFELTEAQKRVLSQIMDDLESHHPMNRLLHGDVGSGKTIIAVICLLTAIDNAAQAALMVPTEILAEQHFLSVLAYCKPLGIKPELITSATPAQEKKRILKSIQSGRASLIVGTHSLIQQDVQFKSLAIAVVDEQHRFGVLQREALGKKGIEPHVLVMSATPIPRSLALVLYGHMDVSVLDEMPPGRQPISTQRHSAIDRDKAYEIVRKEIEIGRQAYIVAPLIEESETRSLKTILDIRNDLQSFLVPGASVDLLHGRMKKDERQAVMERFLNGSVDILVATTVIEVGIDVPNATVMVIEHAERFGLAQLHQLRGRVGRGDHTSHCMLVTYDSVTEDGEARLKALVDSNNGFEIAERDLEIRGPGDFLGTRQSGLPTLRIAQLVRDLPIIEIARKEAFALIDRDPGLEASGHQALKQSMEQLHGRNLDLLKVL